MDKPKKKTVAFAAHDTYYDIALKNRNSALRCYMTADALKNADDKTGMIQYATEISKANEFCMISVVFSAMTAEAFINYYALNHFTKTHFKNRWDKLNLYVKWCLIPLVITTKSLNREGSALLRLDKLIDLRNRLVHYKSTFFDSAEEFAKKKGLEYAPSLKTDITKEYFDILRAFSALFGLPASVFDPRLLRGVSTSTPRNLEVLGVAPDKLGKRSTLIYSLFPIIAVCVPAPIA